MTACPTLTGLTSRFQAVHGTKGGNSEPDRESRPAQLRMGNASEGMQSPSEPTSQTRLGWVQKDTEEGPAHHRPGAGVLKSYAGIHPFILPAKSATLPAASNGYRERSNPLPPLHEGAAGQANDGRGRDWPRSQRLRESRGIC